MLYIRHACMHRPPHCSTTPCSMHIATTAHFCWAINCYIRAESYNRRRLGAHPHVCVHMHAAWLLALMCGAHVLLINYYRCMRHSMHHQQGGQAGQVGAAGAAAAALWWVWDFRVQEGMTPGHTCKVNQDAFEYVLCVCVCVCLCWDGAVPCMVCCCV